METKTGVAGVEIAFDESGLVPCVTQDWSTGEVLTLAYMNREALDRTLEGQEVAPYEALPALGRTLAQRRDELPEGSYSAELFRAGIDRIGAKITEEAEEIVRAGHEESDQRVREESADLLYHLGALLQARGLSYADALEELTRRMGR